MPTINVAIGDEIEAASAISTFEDRCEQLALADRQQVVAEVRAIICDLERRGKELALLGSQFNTVKVLDIPGCRVKLTAAYGIPRRHSILKWFCSLLQRR